MAGTGRDGVVTRREALIGAGAAGASVLLPGRSAWAQGAAKPAEIKVGIATYLSGPASVFGVPAARPPRCCSTRSTRPAGSPG